MAASIAVEEETGVFAGSAHTHNGYYAGDFTASWSTGTTTWEQAPLR